MTKLWCSFLLICLLWSCKTTTAVVVPPVIGVQFTASEQLMPLLEKAKTDKKLVFIDFYTTWCLPCKIMNEEVFSNQGVGEFMNANFINYKVDAEKGRGPDLAVIYNVFAYPTLLFVDSNGTIVARTDGGISASKLKEIGEQVLAEHSKTLNGE